MSFEPRPGARGSRSARKAFAAERRGEQLKRDGALTNEIEVAARAQAEAIQCPICNKPVHPSNFAKHNRNNHPEGKPLHELHERLPLAAIHVDGGTQPRAATNEDTIAEYAEAMQEGATFPALVVFYDGTDYWLADGFHRFYAAQLIGWQDFPAEVRQGTQRDAILHSVGANSTHGLRRTNADKRRAVERLLRDDEWVKWSDREIARRCGVGHNFVSELRKVICPPMTDSNTRTVQRGGTTYEQKTTNIGARPVMTPPGPHPVSKFKEYAGQAAVKPPASEPSLYPSTERPSPFVPERRVPVADEYVEPVGDDFVEDVPAKVVEEAAAESGDNDLLRVGMEVLLKSGQTGRVADINGRIITVDTANGPRVYDVVNVFPMIGEDDEIGEPVHPAIKQQIIDEHYQEKAAEREARRLEMAARREAALSTPLPTGKYRCLVIDPPWPVQKIERDVRPNQDAHLDYPTMSLEDIQALPIRDMADEGGCHLYLWTTQKFLPDALRMMEAWEFEYQCVMPWVKPSGMTPYSWMYNVEFVVFGRRGGLPLLQNGLKLSIEAASEGHSIKPDAFYQKVLLASPEPRLDMFARRERDGFAVWGDEVQEAS